MPSVTVATDRPAEILGDPVSCYRAVSSRDRRFDAIDRDRERELGALVTGVEHGRERPRKTHLERRILVEQRAGFCGGSRGQNHYAEHLAHAVVFLDFKGFYAAIMDPRRGKHHRGAQQAKATPARPRNTTSRNSSVADPVTADRGAAYSRSDPGTK